MFNIIRKVENYEIGHIISCDFLKKCIKNFFLKIEENNNLKDMTVIYKRYRGKINNFSHSLKIEIC